ncbi:uncharacterized protein LOC133713398 isoform X1 [Rosa rugosa]|uniref:uncharacterized protein LOC133713398 isoform X1 n=1 Tax=Rosa rugosa TaxID=74645 RepID=UPI002B4107F3|nr:uncharacterized protein LOC133713398 isoform X1 [Rosa rugosa]
MRRKGEELKSVECLQPASRCCKEIADFVTANPDPLIPTSDSLCKYSHSSISCDSEFQSEVVKDDSLSKVQRLEQQLLEEIELRAILENAIEKNATKFSPSLQCSRAPKHYCCSGGDSFQTRTGVGCIAFPTKSRKK